MKTPFAPSFILTLALTPAFLAAQQAAPPPSDPIDGEPAEQEPIDERAAIIGRIEWLREGRVGPDGRFPLNARLNAYAEIEANEAKGLLETLAIPGSKWIPLGPSPSAGNSGRVSAIAVDPTNSSIVYMGAASGGVWKTTNEGTSWTPLTDDQASLATGSIAIAPSSPSTIYVGTGEGNQSCDSYFGAGVLKSTDSGGTWTLLGNATFANNSISRVVVHPTNPNTLWASVKGGYQTSFLCTNPGATNAGIWNSTDGGANWARGALATGSADRVIIDPANPNTLYGAFSGSGIRKSVNAGLNWTQLAGGLPTTTIGRTDVDIRASDGNLFAILEESSTSGLKGIYRSSDAGGSWAPTATTPASGSLCNGYCWYFIGMEAPSDGSLWARGFSDYRSTDNGGTWTGVNGGTHADHHVITYSPNGNVWIGTDGGAYMCLKTATNCVTAWPWTNKNTGLSMIQFYPGASIHPSTNNYIMGGAQDNGTNRLNGATWSQVYGGDGCWTAIDPTAPTTQYASYQYLVIVKSTLGGPFNSATTGLTDSNTTNSPFIAPFAICPNNTQILIAGSNNVWKTINGATNWSSNSADPLVAGQQLNALAFAPSDATCNTYFVGATNGKFYRTVVGGGAAANWTDITGAIPARGIQDIAVHPTDPKIIYVGLKGFSTNLWKTVNGDASPPTWTSVSSGLPSVPVNAVLLDPSDPTIVYAGTDTGVFRSTNSGTTWTNYSLGLPKVPIFDLVANAATASIVAFTHGRGAWKLATQPAGEAGISTALKITKSGANFSFTWGAGNGCEVNEHGVYRGNLATLVSAGYTHNTALVCTSAATSLSIAQNDVRLTANDYFLAVASNGGEEGSYGHSTPGPVEIPVSTARCRPAQNVTVCP